MAPSSNSSADTIQEENEDEEQQQEQQEENLHNNNLAFHEDEVEAQGGSSSSSELKDLNHQNSVHEEHENEKTEKHMIENENKENENKENENDIIANDNAIEVPFRRPDPPEDTQSSSSDEEDEDQEEEEEEEDDEEEDEEEEEDDDDDDDDDDDQYEYEDGSGNSSELFFCPRGGRMPCEPPGSHIASTIPPVPTLRTTVRHSTPAPIPTTITTTTPTTTSTIVAPSQSPRRQLRQKRPKNLLATASCVSKLFFNWAWPLLRLGATRPLEDSDLPPLLQEDSSTFNRQAIEKLLLPRSSRTKKRQPTNNKKKNKHNNKNLLFYTLCRNYLWETWFSQFLLLVSMMARIGQAVALGWLLEEFTKKSFTTEHYQWMAVLIACGAILFPAKQQQFFLTYRKGMQLRIGLVACIFDKSLRLEQQQQQQQRQQPTSKSSSSSSSSLKKSGIYQNGTTNTTIQSSFLGGNGSGGGSGSSAAHVANLASNDVERFIMATVTGMYLIWAPLETIVILAIGYQMVLGLAFVLGYSLFLAFLFVQSLSSQKFSTLRRQVASSTDARMGLVSQVIAGARVLKMNAWEPALAHRIAQLRRLEMNRMKQSNKYVLTRKRTEKKSPPWMEKV
jgi:uncharacterized membrane protein YgcG